MESTNTEYTANCPPTNFEEESTHQECELSTTDLARLSRLYKQLKGDDTLVSDSLVRHIVLARQKRRSSAQYRRRVEDSLYEWLTLDFQIECWSDDRFVDDLRLDCQDMSECEAIDLAIWVVQASDRRVREPILKRLHVEVNKLPTSERPDFFEKVKGRISRVIRVSPTKETVALTSMLALVAWQGDDPVMAQAAVAFGHEQDPDNVLLQLVYGALVSGLPKSAWAEVMDEYTLTQLRAG